MMRAGQGRRSGALFFNETELVSYAVALSFPGEISMRCGCARGVVVFACQILLCAALCGQEPKEEEPPLPLKRVVLFSSSVGFFEHGGQVEGNRQIEFAFKSAEINDLLKSLVVQDRDGGLVTAVNYGSPEAL